MSSGPVSYTHLDVYKRQEKGRYFGATCGRYANRLAGASFRLNGITCSLSANKGVNSLHGGGSGFDDKSWKLSLIHIWKM